MNKLTIRDLYKNTDEFADSIITVEGWVKTVRDSKNFGFIEINDRKLF